MSSLSVYQLQENSCPALENTHISLQKHDWLLVLQHTQAENTFFFFKLHFSCFKTSMLKRNLWDAHSIRFLVPQLPAFHQSQQAWPDNSHNFIPGRKGDRWVTFPMPTAAGVIPDRKKMAKLAAWFLLPVWLEGFIKILQSLQYFIKTLFQIYGLETLARHHQLNTFCFWSDLIVVCWSTDFFFFNLWLPLWKKSICNSLPSYFGTAAHTSHQHKRNGCESASVALPEPWCNRGQWKSGVRC